MTTDRTLGKMRNAHKTSVITSEGKKPLWMSSHRSREDIKIDLMENRM
jgi:hypothetical protein